MITAIALPADMAQPIRLVELHEHDLDAYRALVGGSLEIVTFERPAATLYLNDEGKLDGLPVNQRATLLAWVHNSAFRDVDVIVGDAFIVGAADQHGDDLTVPEELVTLLFHTRYFRVLVRFAGDARLYANLTVFSDWLAAYTNAVQMAVWQQVEEVRVIPLS